MRHIVLVEICLIAVALTSASCNSSDPLLKPRDGGAIGTGGTGSTGWPSGTGGFGGGVATKIPIGMTACSDGQDNDGDGKSDYDDPECVGPADNDEGSFATGIPGDNIDACKQDCFFDGNSGMGDDGCLWQLKCDPANAGATAEKKCPYDAQYAAQHADECSVSSSQSQGCVDHCRKLTPNGCDCFGCCVVTGAPTPIRLAATCTAAKYGDPTACPSCTQVTSCDNPCERCEICLGKTTLPADCRPDGGTGYDGGYDGGTPQCPPNIVSCGPGGEVSATGCPTNTGCLTGCCVPIIP